MAEGTFPIANILYCWHVHRFLVIPGWNFRRQWILPCQNTEAVAGWTLLLINTHVFFKIYGFVWKAVPYAFAIDGLVITGTILSAMCKTQYLFNNSFMLFTEKLIDI